MEEQAEYKTDNISNETAGSQSVVERSVMPRPFYEDSYVTIYHGDCEQIIPLLSECDLLLTDPPYGIGAYKTGTMGGGVLAKQSEYAPTEWDDKPPPAELIDAMMLKSKWQIVWGGNYFNVPPSSCWLVWDKDNGSNNFADCELAWTNMPKAVRKIRYRWQGMLQERMGKDKEVRVHPTQKPLPVMIWAIKQAPDDVATILDPFMGSGTTLVAAKELGKRAIGIERDLGYCQAAVKRLRQESFDFG
jgi:DNA modification methylase